MERKNFCEISETGIGIFGDDEWWLLTAKLFLIRNWLLNFEMGCEDPIEQFLLRQMSLCEFFVMQ